jgi:hypothetical protein
MFYGYPETAIRAMEIKKEAELRGERIDNFVSADDLPLEIKGIKSFNYSKDNWREEAKTDIRWAKEISLVNSSLHDKFFRK